MEGQVMTEGGWGERGCHHAETEQETGFTTTPAMSASPDITARTLPHTGPQALSQSRLVALTEACKELNRSTI